MDALQVLCTRIRLEGENSFVWSFSAKSISEDQNISIYRSRKLLKELREYGLIYRVGNRYMFTFYGWEIANDLIRAANRVTKYQPARSS